MRHRASEALGVKLGHRRVSQALTRYFTLRCGYPSLANVAAESNTGIAKGDSPCQRHQC